MVSVVLWTAEQYNGLTLKKRLIITIDGPAGSGKSTVAAQLARRLGVTYLDTGAMYRALTWAALDRNICLDDAAALKKLAQESRIEPVGLSGSVGTAGSAGSADSDNPSRISLDGRDVTKEIRSPEVTDNSHKIADQPEIRSILVDQQRRIGQAAGSLVTEGRDQGTVVFPDADFKFYLDASESCRAQRRVEQLKTNDTEVGFDEILSTQQQRDQRDSARAVGPLKIPPGGHVIDTTEMNIDQVVETLYDFIMAEEREG